MAITVGGGTGVKGGSPGTVLLSSLVGGPNPPGVIVDAEMLRRLLLAARPDTETHAPKLLGWTIEEVKELAKPMVISQKRGGRMKVTVEQRERPDHKYVRNVKAINGGVSGPEMYDQLSVAIDGREATGVRE